MTPFGVVQSSVSVFFFCGQDLEGRSMDGTESFGKFDDKIFDCSWVTLITKLQMIMSPV